ncbi:MAG: tetratricopeptide repeat protein [Planctomycetota bacterium]
MVAAVFLLYLPALKLNFIWDDDHYVTSNPTMLSSDGLISIWTDPDSSPQYYPVTFSVLWIQYQLFGQNAAGYHAVNILLHAFNGVLCLAILRRLNLRAAFWIALAFCIHPIQVETVAWVTEIKNLLSGTFYGLAWWFIWPALLDSEQRSGDSSNQTHEQHDLHQKRHEVDSFSRTGAIVGAVAFFCCALLSKSITATLPAAMGVAYWYVQGSLTRKQVLVLAPMFLLGAWAGWQTASMEREHVGAMGTEWDYGMLERTGIAAQSLLHYFKQCLFPTEQVFFYPRYATELTAMAWLAIGICLLTLVTLVAWTLRSGRRGAICSAAFMVGSSLPALGFLNVYPHRFSFVADHFVYLSVIGAFCFIWSFVFSCAEYLVHRWQLKPVWVMLPVLGLFLWFSVGTRIHIPNFASEETLWVDTLEKNPGAVAAMQNLALVYVNQNRPREAMQLLQRAEKYDFDRFQTLNTMGMVLGILGETEKAKQAFEESILENGENPQPWNNLGNLARVHGSAKRNNSPVYLGFEQPQEYYQTAWEVRPNYLSAFALGVLAYEGEDYANAAIWYARAVEQRPWDLDARFNLAHSFFAVGRKQEASELCHSILREYPKDRPTKQLLRKCR